MMHAKIERLANAAADGFSDRALESSTVDPGALAVARRHDPYAPPGRADHLAVPGDERHDRLAADLRLKRLASLDDRFDQPAPSRGLRLRGVLDESRDLECLTQAVYYEARGESSDGQAAVAQVVMNRTRHPAFPATVCGVVFQGAAAGKCQFSFACDGSVRRRVENAAWRRAERVAARALGGAVMAQVGGATHFHVARLSPEWSPGLLKVAQVGAHVFYRFGGRRSSPAPFTLTPAPDAPATIQAVQPLPQVQPAAQPVYASLALAPLATTVAATVADAAAAGAELVISAASPKPVQTRPGPAPKVETAAAPAPSLPKASPSIEAPPKAAAS